MKLMTVARLLIAVFVAGATCTQVFGAEIADSYFSETYTDNRTELILVGVGLLRYWGFKAYTGAFYLEQGVAIDQALADRAKRLELEYFRPIKGKDFGPATEESIAKNVDPETYLRLRSQIEQLNSLYEDVQPGDRYSLTYIPGKGTELALNGIPKGIIEGADFAAAVFSIWLGDAPINDSFKKQILGL